MSLDSIVSERVARILDASTLANFDRWRIAFKKAAKKLGVARHFHELSDLGCAGLDLEWVLFWIAETLDRSKEPPENVRTFFEALKDIVPLTEQLTNRLESLLAFTRRNGRVLDAYLAAYGPGSASRIYGAPVVVKALQSEIEALLIVSGGKFPRAAQLTIATAAEALFVSYVKHATGKNIAFKYGSLLYAASEAYGLDGREYDEAAMIRRHNRFREDHRREMAEISLVAKTYVGFRSMPGCMGLIPFYLESEVNRLRKVLIRELRNQGHI